MRTQRIIVVYEDGPSSPSALAAENATGVVRVRDISQLDGALVEIVGDEPMESVLARLRAQPGVRSAQPDASMRVSPIRGPAIRP
ncbi:S8 family serine peptidase [Luteibacter rhizovicinus]|uniref:S8 family serine peptidase n=1 Tax=Luteibacter rhizovicinus TaxID=242606 RepID=UPI0010510F03|nr:hypothetical protein [Luteibacter rhizovicinus]